MASPKKHISLSDRNGVLVITVLDKHLSEERQVSEWRSQMADAIRRTSPAGVVIDMRKVEYMTSIALFPLVATRAVAEETGAKIVLCNLSQTVATVLTVTQLIVESRPHAKHLAIAENLNAAVALLTGDPA